MDRSQSLELPEARAAVEDLAGVQVREAGQSDYPRRAARSVSPEEYAANVRSIDDLIDQGVVEKVVLSRDVAMRGNSDAWRQALAEIERAYPWCWTFAVAGLFGATPELLASKFGSSVHSRVLAGSLPRTGAIERVSERLTTDPRLREEHRFAADSVLRGLRLVAELDDNAPEPFVLELPNILHLATDVRGSVSDPSLTVLDIVDRIHPTAAVAGIPRGPAMRTIAEVEGRDRGRYAGPVGWMDAGGDGEIGLALRCGQVFGDEIVLFAGGGIVAGADPSAELAETESKLQPMLRALGVVSEG